MAQEGPSSEKRVAVIEDHASLRVSLVRALRAYDITADAFDSAEDYLRRGDRAESSCLVLDLQLPGMSGLELMKELGASGRSLPPVIIMSAHGDLLAEAARFNGAIGYLQKPFSMETLVELLRPYLAHSAEAGSPEKS